MAMEQLRLHLIDDGVSVVNVNETNEYIKIHTKTDNKSKLNVLKSFNKFIGTYGLESKFLINKRVIFECKNEKILATNSEGKSKLMEYDNLRTVIIPKYQEPIKEKYKYTNGVVFNL